MTPSSYRANGVIFIIIQIENDIVISQPLMT